MALFKFAELCAHTHFSFLQGASRPIEMIARAKELGYTALGVADLNGFYGIPQAHTAAKDQGLPLLVGTQVTPFARLFAMNRNGYGHLCQWLSEKVLNVLPVVQPKEAPFLEDTLLLLDSRLVDEKTLLHYQAFYQDRLYLVVSRFLDGQNTVPLAVQYAKKHGISCVASNQPLFHVPERKLLQDVLTSIHHQKPLCESGFRLLPNAERHLKSIEEMGRLFSDHSEWLTNTLEVVERCDFSLDEIRYHYPQEWIPQGYTADAYLEKLVWEGAEKRYPSGISHEVRKQLLHEMALIRDLSYADYFLTTWDIVRYARSQNILCQGRGSAANSVVCYVLGITAIDPIRMSLLFERFLSRERKEPPDIDIDFEHERREEVIQYLYSRYGRHRAAISAEVICYRKKSALREVAKALSIPLESVEKLLLHAHKRNLNTLSFSELHTKIPEVSPGKLDLYLRLVQELLGFPRHLGTHVGGFVLSHDALNRSIPVQAAAMANRTIIQWDKNDLDALGFVRVDVLGLGILTAIQKSFTYLKETYNKTLDLASVPAEDPAVYQMLERADSIGVFQIESRAQMNMLPRLKPRCFYDLVVEIALVRPGPIQGEMVHPYLKRKQGKEQIFYPHPDLEKILGKTCGVPLFQEQIMKMAMVVAGFSPGEADELRRAMGSWRRWPNRLVSISERFRQALLDRGISQEFADRIYSQIQGFAEYGFPESHAASFAILAYTTAYLKCHHPDAFVCALLNSQPMGFYTAHSLIFDAKRHGVNFLPVAIGKSRWDSFLENPMEIRLGYREVSGLAKKVGTALEGIQAASFLDFIDALKTKLSPHVLTHRDLFLIAAANGFEPLKMNRREAFWQIQALDLQDGYHLSYLPDSTSLPKESPWEKVSLDYEAQGVSLYQHPVALLRPQLVSEGICDSRVVNKGKALRGKKLDVAGLVICRQMPPTASGVLFITLEDEFGFINLVIWNAIYEKYREILLSHSFLHCRGRLEKAQDGEVYHVIVETAAPLQVAERGFEPVDSHDFH